MESHNNIRVLVVGGAGYIGGGVVDALLREGILCTVYDNLLYEHQYLKPVDFIFGDVRDTEKLSRALPKYTHVIWLAAIVGDAACQVSPSLTKAVNQEAVLWLAVHYRGRILFTSTCSVYGQADERLDETASMKPRSLYAQTKREAENYLLEHDNCLIFRLGTAYGISDAYARLRMDLVVNYMTANAVMRGELTVYGGTQWRPLIHVNDIAEALVRNIGLSTRGIYNLATVNLQIKDLAGIVSGVTGCRINYTKKSFEDERNYHVDAAKAMRDGVCDFSHIRDIPFGVREVAEPIRAGKIKYAEHDIYFNEKHLTNLLQNGKLT